MLMYANSLPIGRQDALGPTFTYHLIMVTSDPGCPSLTTGEARGLFLDPGSLSLVLGFTIDLARSNPWACGALAPTDQSAVTVLIRKNQAVCHRLLWNMLCSLLLYIGHTHRCLIDFVADRSQVRSAIFFALGCITAWIQPRNFIAVTVHQPLLFIHVFDVSPHVCPSRSLFDLAQVQGFESLGLKSDGKSRRKSDRPLPGGDSRMCCSTVFLISYNVSEDCGGDTACAL